MKKNKRIAVFTGLAITDSTKQEKISGVPLPSQEDIKNAKEWVDENEL